MRASSCRGPAVYFALCFVPNVRHPPSKVARLRVQRLSFQPDIEVLHGDIIDLAGRNPAHRAPVREGRQPVCYSLVVLDPLDQSGPIGIALGTSSAERLSDPGDGPA